jgi:hypothetical protein
MLHGGHVIPYFLHVIVFRALLRWFHLVEQEISQARFGAFNARRQHRFASDIGSNQQMGIGQMSPESRQFAESGIGARQHSTNWSLYVRVGGSLAGMNAE